MEPGKILKYCNHGLSLNIITIKFLEVVRKRQICFFLESKGRDHECEEGISMYDAESGNDSSSETFLSCFNASSEKSKNSFHVISINGIYSIIFPIS